MARLSRAELLARVDAIPDPRVRAASLRIVKEKYQITPRVELRQHLEEVDPGPHLDWWHVGAMIEDCQAVLDGEIKRLMLHAPPRYYKSRTVVQGAASCAIRNTPSEFVALLFASDKLARFHSQFAREAVEKAGIELRRDSQDKALWMVEGHHGGMWITTIRGKPLGFGWRLGIVDDPLGSYEEAQTRTAQRIAENAYDSFLERSEKGEPRPALIVMHQRLAKRDLAGRLYEREADAARAAGWTVRDLAVRARVRRLAYPATCTVLPDPRSLGEPLCPELEGVEAIEARRNADPFRAAAVDDQEPMEAASGGVFRRSWMPIIGGGRQDLADQRGALEAMAGAGEIAPIIGWWRGHDFSAGGADATADALLAKLEPGKTCAEARGAPIEYVWLDPSESYPAAAAVPGKVLDRARSDGKDVIQVIPDEIGTGKVISSSLAQTLRGEGYAVEQYTQTRAKKARALPHANATASNCGACGALIADPEEAEALGSADLCKCKDPKIRPGRVAVLAGPMAERLRQVHHDFTGEEGGEDDLVDAASGAYNQAEPLAFAPALPRPRVQETPSARSRERQKALRSANW